MKRSFIEENQRERERLRSLVERLTEDQLKTPLGEDWTVAITLAHLAFWDQRSLTLIRKWKQTGVVEPSPIDIDITNEALLPLWRALPPRAAAELAVASAEAIDRELEETADDMIARIERDDEKWRVYRCRHRKMHLDQIGERLGKGRSV
jgi:hypothetical protein